MCVSLSICNFVLVSDRQWLPSIDNQKLRLGSYCQHNSPFAGGSVTMIDHMKLHCQDHGVEGLRSVSWGSINS